MKFVSTLYIYNESTLCKMEILITVLAENH